MNLIETSVSSGFARISYADGATKDVGDWVVDKPRH
jgi:hypothetical protein